MEVVALAQGLIASDHAYVRDGAVYFRGADVPRRAGLDADRAHALLAEYGDVPGDPAKEHPFDVAVWRPSRSGEPAWPSPWGTGRPGWHAECTAMAMTTFGPALDLHSGGTDLRFPHHAYEAAMAEALTGVRPFSRAWLHVGMVCRDGVKMAKSTGNLVLVSDLIHDHAAPAVRLMLLTEPWADEWDYTPGDLDRAAADLDRLHQAAAAAARPPRPGGGDPGTPRRTRPAHRARCRGAGGRTHRTARHAGPGPRLSLHRRP